MESLYLNQAQFEVLFQITKEVTHFVRNRPEPLARQGMTPGMAGMLMGILRRVDRGGVPAGGVRVVVVADPVTGFGDVSVDDYVMVPGASEQAVMEAVLRVPMAIASVWQRVLRFIMDSWGDDEHGRGELWLRTGYQLEELSAVIEALGPLGR
jgi:hypothetical protein